MYRTRSQITDSTRAVLDKYNADRAWLESRLYNAMAAAVSEFMNGSARIKLPDTLAGIVCNAAEALAAEYMHSPSEDQSAAQEAALIALAEAHGLRFVDCVW